MARKILYILAIMCFTLNAVQAQINVGVMLPLHDNDGDGRRMTEYYRGILLAVKELKAEGKNINVRAWNVPIDADPRTTLLQDGTTDCQIIFAPLYTKQVKVIGDFCRAYNVKMVIPFSINGNDVDKNPSIYQVYMSPDEMYATSIQRVAENFRDFHPVFIDCNDTTSRKGAFTFGLRKILEKNGVEYNITNLRSSDEMFAKAFSLNQPNLVILNTGRSPELRAAMDKLDYLTRNNQGVRISMFGYTEWLMYAKFYKDRLAKYDTYIPTNFYYNEQSEKTKLFEQRYRWAFHQDMMNALPHFAATGYDHAMYFLADRQTWMQTPLKFVKTSSGGYRNKAYMLIHYKTDGGIDALQY
ncbi:MAG: ABC transporter substrate-binding protein [Prevotella sp.]|nr:ABC transporter substrate-binding protein [Prevotella sp.]MBR4651212.1 ABC transporter substrate-binding protein [Prevotella sp.]